MKFRNKALEAVELEKALTEAKKLSIYGVFDSLSKANQQTINGVVSDVSGGFIRKDKLQFYADALGIKYDTLRKKMPLLVKEGWAEKRHTGWCLISWKKVAAKYGLQIKKRFVSGTKKSERRLSGTMVAIKAQRKKNVNWTINNRELYPEKLRSTHLRSEMRRLHKSHSCSVSIRQIGKKLGLKSAMTTWRNYQKLIKQGLIKIEKFYSSTEFCKPEELYLRIKENPLMANKLFRYKGKVYERLMLNVIVK